MSCVNGGSLKSLIFNTFSGFSTTYYIIGELVTLFILMRYSLFPDYAIYNKHNRETMRIVLCFSRLRQTPASTIMMLLVYKFCICSNKYFSIRSLFK